jgi:capsular polysaccharide export protein
MPQTDRRFLLLQGPHGPFFSQLGAMLRAAGCEVWRVGFNRGDEAFWHDPARYIAFDAPPENWPATCRAILTEHRITDIALYGDTRPIHAKAVEIARELGLCVHVFEEGYLRPYWVTYERGGANGHSRLMDMSVAEMRAALARSQADPTPAPAQWGEMRQHVFYGALYHFFVMAMNRRYRHFQPHRSISVFAEFRLYQRRLLLMPLHSLERRNATRRVRNGGFPFHLVLLQLEHDASFQTHSPFATMTEFVDLCIAGFAEGAPRHHHLVFKAHPLEDGRVGLRAAIEASAKARGVGERVHFLRGGKLEELLAQARSAVTVNSTAAQQVLWRGLPLRAFGRAVFDKPEFVSTQPLGEFFARPDRPDSRAYREYRRFLLETSQVPGGYYSARGRRQLTRQIIDMMLSPDDPYEALIAGKAAPRQQLPGEK